MDGFDYGWGPNIAAYPLSTPQKYINYASGGFGSAQPGRVSAPSLGGGNCYRFDNAGFSQETATKVIGPGHARLVVGFAYRNFNTVIDDTAIFRFEGGAPTLVHGGNFDDGTNTSTVIMLRQMPDGTMNVYAGNGLACGTSNFPGTLLATLTATFPTGAWKYIEVVSTQFDWAVYVDDVLDQSGSYAFPFTPTAFSWQKFSFEIHDKDDAYCATDRLGPVRVTGFGPSVQGAQQWARAGGSNNLSQIGEFGNLGSPVPDGDATYVSTSSGGAFDLYGFTAPGCFGRIIGLALNADGRLVSGTPPQLVLLAQKSGTQYPIGVTDPLDASYAMRQACCDVSPATGTFWTDREIASTQFGYQFSGATTARVTQFFLEKVTSLRAVPFKCGQGSYSF